MNWREFAPKVALLLIGAVLTLAVSWTYGKLIEPDRELTYRIESHDDLIANSAFGNLETTVDGRTVEALVFHQVRLQNTGNDTIQDIQGSIDFGEPDSEFRIFSSAHESSAGSTFQVVPDDSVRTRRDFTYPFLNSGEEVVITLTTNQFREFSVHFRAENTRIQEDDRFRDGNIVYFTKMQLNVFVMILVIIGGAMVIAIQMMDRIANWLFPKRKDIAEDTSGESKEGDLQ